MTDEPTPLRPYCPSCERPAGDGHKPDCEFMADLERWFMDAAGLHVPAPGGVKAWREQIRRDEG